MKLHLDETLLMRNSRTSEKSEVLHISVVVSDQVKLFHLLRNFDVLDVTVEAMLSHFSMI